MKRRDFIRMGSFITISVATLGVTGCNSDNTSSGISRPMPPLATGDTWAFPQSIASGDPHPDSIMLWTRVTPSSLLATDSSTVSVAIQLNITTADPLGANSASLGSNAALTGVTLPTVAVPAYGDFDGTVRHKLTGLEAGKVYYYQFVAGTVHSKIGRFKTAAAVTSSDNVKFAFMTCQDWSSNHWAAFSQIVADDIATPADLDFIIHLGDYIYETDAAAGAEGAHSAIILPNGTSIPPAQPGGIAPGGKYASELADYRYLYKLYRSDPRIQAVHERFPMIAIWDDHEFSDDSWQASETYTNANASQPERRRHANQAWFEFMPADISFSETDTSFNNIRLYRDLKFGSVMHLIMTDERLYRTDHVIAETTINPSTGLQLGRINSRYLAPEGNFKLLEGFKSTVFPDPLQALTMLGATQRNWWKTSMSSSSAAWKVWGNEVSLMRMGLNGTKAVAVLVGLGTISSAKMAMTVSLSDPNVQALPKVAAGAGAAMGLGATAAIAIPASFTILQTYAATADAGSAIAAGEAAGLTNAQATAVLGAIGAKTPTAAEIGICATTVVAATTAYMSTPMPQATATVTAAGTVVSMLLADAAYMGSAPDAALLAAAKGTSTTLGDIRGTVLVNVYNAAKAQGGVSTTAQVDAGYAAFSAPSMASPTGVMLSFIKIEIETHTTASSFVIASGQASLLGDFMQKFLLNADQWDGYRKERQDLMQFLEAQAIQNVVAVTGDIHAFYAGQVHSTFSGEVTSVNNAGVETAAAPASLPAAGVMVDLVTAGISSLSWFSYLNAAAASLSSSLVTLVSYTLPGSATGLPFDVVLPVLDFTMGKPFSGPALVSMISNAIKLATVANGIPEASLEAGAGASITAIASAIAGNPSLQVLCAELSSLGLSTNPWLKHVDTDAQGYAVVTAATGSLTCEFKRLNTLFISGGTGYAPGTVEPRPVVNTTTTVSITAGSTALTIT